MNIGKKLLFGIAVLTFCLGTAAKVLAIGMITEPIVIKSILRGGEISKTVTVFNPQNIEVVYQLGTDGAIKGWAEFFEQGKPDIAVTKVNVPPKAYYDVIAKIKVPDGTPNGDYQGEIFVKQEATDKPKEGESSVGVAQMVSREVTITVTDQEVTKLHTTLIPESYDVASGDALKIKIIYENLGNISVKPSFQLKITASEGGKTVLNAIYPYSETEEAVKPGETKTMPTFEWLTAGQPTGRYIAEATTLVGTEVPEKNSFRFNIGSASSISGSVLGAFITKIGGGKTAVGWAVIGGVIALLAAVLVFLFFKKRKPSSVKIASSEKLKRTL